MANKLETIKILGILGLIILNLLFDLVIVSYFYFWTIPTLYETRLLVQKFVPTVHPIMERPLDEHCDFLWINLQLVLFDPYFFFHLFGWWSVALFTGDFWFCYWLGVLHEILEWIFKFSLPNIFAECWWDTLLLDLFGCNLLGNLLGVWFSHIIWPNKQKDSFFLLPKEFSFQWLRFILKIFLLISIESCSFLSLFYFKSYLRILTHHWSSLFLIFIHRANLLFYYLDQDVLSILITTSIVMSITLKFVFDLPGIPWICIIPCLFLFIYWEYQRMQQIWHRGVRIKIQ